MAWLVRDGDVLASVELADTPGRRRRGLIGRHDLEGVLVLRPCRHVHSLGLRFSLDVACCDDDGFVLRTAVLAPWRLGPIARHTAFVVEARAGAFERWQLTVGDCLEIRE